MELEENSANIHPAAPEEHLPESYRSHSAKETQLLAIVENFQRQFSYLFPDRKPLLLCPANECGVKKFVSTTLRPTAASHPKLFSLQGCASFVADSLLPVPLDSPLDLPKRLSSPTSVLRSQRGTCFEYATLLCSLLLGEHYDAYCVSGYAVKDVCLLDQSLQECPLLDAEVKSAQRGIPEEKQQDKKYFPKPQKELKSRYLTKQEKKKPEAEAVLPGKLNLQERDPDPLQGLRVHCWVLVLSGSRDVHENVFIDPLSGIGYPTNSDNFLGIESVWNNLNYYVNMQDCSHGCADLVFDLEDLKFWEPVLFDATSKKQLILEAQKRKEGKKIKEEDVPTVFRMPRSWVSCISISIKALKSPWPGGQKVTRYRQAQLERFAPYVRSDGLVTRLTKYKDLDCTEVTVVREWYQHRNDFLEEREVNNIDKVTTERFKRGRSPHLLCFRSKSLTTGTEREMHFSSARDDNLVRRVLSQREMIEDFEDRSDLLCYRHVYFQQPAEQFAENAVQDVQNVQRAIERFHRNSSKPPNKDVAERVFFMTGKVIEVTYHKMEGQFIPSKVSFIRPLDSSYNEIMRALDKASTFQADLSESAPTLNTLHMMLVALMEDENKLIKEIEQSQNEARAIMVCREQEEKNIKLRKQTARAHRQKQETVKSPQEEPSEQDKYLKFLDPFMIQLSNKKTLSPEEAKQFYQDCLTAFKSNMEEKANFIEECYKKKTQELQEKQLWFQREQHMLNEEQLEEYKLYCVEKTIQIRGNQKYLERHLQIAEENFKTFEQKLRNDPLLSPHL